MSQCQKNFFCLSFSDPLFTVLFSIFSFTLLFCDFHLSLFIFSNKPKLIESYVSRIESPCVLKDESTNPLMVFRSAYIIHENGQQKIWISSEVPREFSREWWEAPGILPDLLCNGKPGLFKPNFVADKWPSTAFTSGSMLCNYIENHDVASISFKSENCTLPINLKRPSIKTPKQVTSCVAPLFGTPDVDVWFTNNVDDFDHVYIYQTGDIPPRIRENITRPMVTLIDWSAFFGDNIAYHSQSLAFEDCIKRAELDGFEWVAFTDFDSHISSRKHENLHEYINSLNADVCYAQMKLFDQPPSCDPPHKDNLFPRFCDKYLIKPSVAKNIRVHSAIVSDTCEKVYPLVQDLHHLHISDASLRGYSRFPPKECTDAHSWEEMNQEASSKECKW